MKKQTKKTKPKNKYKFFFDGQAQNDPESDKNTKLREIMERIYNTRYVKQSDIEGNCKSIW